MPGAAPASGLTDAERIDWLRLIRSENVGPRTFSALLQRYRTARAALAALPEIASRGGAKRFRVCSVEEAEAELATARKSGAVLIGRGEPAYPARLLAIDDPPPLLAVCGDTEILARPAVAIVGSRNASGAGQKFAAQLAGELGRAGLAVVSGLARGIDGAAHRASAATGTVAVLAGGLDRLYPPEHADLAIHIRDAGVLLSEMPFGWEARARDFPRRNRLIAGLALGVVVIEAARRSGSLITARFALEQGREVFAVPGSPLDPRAEGTNALLKQGATLVTCAEDVLGVVTPMLRLEPPSMREPSECSDDAQWAPIHDSECAAITNLLGPSPLTLDDLVRLSGAPPSVVRTVLLELEIAGRLERSGGRFALI